MNKKRAILLIILIIVGIFATDQILKIALAPGIPILNGDPDVVTQLYSASGASGTLGEFNINQGGFQGGVTGPIAGSVWTGSEALRLNANGTSNGYAVAISKTSFDPSSVSGKHLKLIAFFKQISGSLATNQRLIFFLTRNSTAPKTATWSPLTDLNVALTTKFFQCGADGGGFDYCNQVNIQSNPIESINSEDSGACGGASSCFLNGEIFYSNGAYAPTTVTQTSFWLNFTGNTISAPGSSGVCGALSGGSGCSVGVITPAGIFRADTGEATISQPRFQFQGVNYYLGVMLEGGSSVTFDIGLDAGLANIPCQVDPTGAICNGVHSFQTGIAQILSTPVAIAPHVDTGGFFGPVIKALISIGVFVLNSVLSFLGFIATAIKIGLNSLGGFFGWGNIGDSFINAANGIASSIVAVANAITNFLSGIVARGLDLITLVTTLSGTFFTGLQKFLSEMSTLSAGLVTIVSKLFLYGGATYFLYDVIMFFSMTGEGGVDGFGAWFGLNRWISFAFFGIMTRILNALISAFDWVLSHIPTIGARMPEGGFPGVPQLSAGDRPSFFPSANMSKIREGDPFAVFFWIVGGFLVLPLYLSSSISPLSGLVAANGCNPTVCFSNMLTSVGYPFAGLFLLGLAVVAVQSFIFGASGEEKVMTVKVQNERSSGHPVLPKNVSAGRIRRGSRERRIIARADRFIRAEYGDKR